MTEKEKMLNGDLYLSFGEELFTERQKAKELLFDFNALRPSMVTERNTILKDLLGFMGENIFIEPPFRADYGYNISFGNRSYSNYNLTVLDCAKVTIGDDVLIGPNVNLFTAGHPIDVEERLSGLEYAYPIIISDRCWIGGGVTINAGISIGENTIIGSGSVVTKDIPANVIACGNPCRVIKNI
ncbi:sugar O-acetyltransferase [uncultured Clostridium sp.]|uniref:sugar O-acetyltransferase n=1 Tax=uncultured Clostridium sp. TaxID=59620 RepID=UPI002602FE20|nr:sugar O-acetyltransferase [uncultured Clostridium sp.]